MKKNIFSIAAFQMALVFWFLESAIHYFIFEETQFEFIPSERNELWMRVVIVFLIMLLGVFADGFIRRIQHHQMRVAHVYNSLIQTSNQTLGNLLGQMKLFRLEASKCRDFDPAVIQSYDSAIAHASELIVKLSNVDRALKEATSDGKAEENSSDH